MGSAAPVPVESEKEVRSINTEQKKNTQSFERIRKGKLVKGTRIKGFKNQKIIASTLINFNKRNRDLLSQRQQAPST